MVWLDEWDDDITDIFADFGEAVSWRPVGGEPVTITVVLQRGDRGRDVTNAETSRLEGRARVLVRTADLPAGAGQFDRITLPVKKAGEELEIWVVGMLERDLGNGVVAYDVRYAGTQQVRTKGLEVGMK